MSEKPAPYDAGQGTIQDRIEQGEKVRVWATAVAEWMPTAKKETYLLGIPTEISYLDEKVRIRLSVVREEQFSRCEIALNTPDGLQAVLAGDSTGLQLFHPGQWCQYVYDLYQQATRKHDAERRHRSVSQQADLEARYAPVDDSALFEEKV